MIAMAVLALLFFGIRGALLVALIIYFTSGANPLA